jgi:hypothetical protein
MAICVDPGVATRPPVTVGVQSVSRCGQHHDQAPGFGNSDLVGFGAETDRCSICEQDGALSTSHYPRSHGAINSTGTKKLQDPGVKIE